MCYEPCLNKYLTQNIYIHTLFDVFIIMPHKSSSGFECNIKFYPLYIAVSMLSSGTSVFFIWWVKATENIVVILGCVFNALSIAGWNALNVLSAESYPTELRLVSTYMYSIEHLKYLICHLNIMMLVIIVKTYVNITSYLMHA